MTDEEKFARLRRVDRWFQEWQPLPGLRVTGITRDEGVPYVLVVIRNDETSQEAAVNLQGDYIWHSDDPLAKAQDMLSEVVAGLLPQGGRAAPGDQVAEGTGESQG